ncbi:MAG: hypothetical protein NC411_02640 [Bacteroides sp.]|nr:hypothetical protein [Bacteroides sp.]
MRKIIILAIIAICSIVSVKAISYEEAFDSIKAMPNMKGVKGTLISGNNDFSALGITNAQMILWTGETGSGNETEVYGNSLYGLIGELPASEMIQARMTDSSILAIFAKPISKDSNRILILSDSAGAGFTGALIGYINDRDLNSLRQAILTSREGGGTSVYLNALNF